MGRRGFVALCLTCAGAACPLSAQAKAASFPARTLTILVADERDGTLDLTARVVGPALAKALGKGVTVENRPGDGGLRAQTAGAKARPDGHTLVLAGTTDLTVAPRLAAKPPTRLEDFAGIGSVTETPLVIEVPAGSRFQSFAELAAKAKARPGTVRIRHSGHGTTGHLAILRLQERLDATFTAVADKASPDRSDGAVDAVIARIPREIGPRRGGAFKPLAVTGLKRAATLPDTPTLNELGLKGFEIMAVTGLFAPARTPPAAIAILADALQKALDDAEVQAKFKRLGSEARAMRPDAFDALLKQEDAAAAQMIEDGLLKAE